MFNYLLKLFYISYHVILCLFTKTLILWNFTKKVDNGDLGSFTVIDGIAEDKRNFLAGEISGSFEKVVKFGLKSDLAK